MEEQVDVDFGFSKDVHDGDAFVLELQQVLDVNVHVLQADTHELGVDLEHAVAAAAARLLGWR